MGIPGAMVRKEIVPWLGFEEATLKKQEQFGSATVSLEMLISLTLMRSTAIRMPAYPLFAIVGGISAVKAEGPPDNSAAEDKDLITMPAPYKVKGAV